MTFRSGGFPQRLAAAFVIGVLACGSPDAEILAGSGTWLEAVATRQSCPISGASSACSDCVRFKHVVRLGSEDGPGFLVDRGTIGDVVRDHRGNYWVSQGDHIKVFGPRGGMVASLGRAGAGPMEFQFAQPVHTDSGGRVHVFDGRNLRVSAIGPDFALAEEQAVPFPASRVTAVADGRRYVVNWWTATADRLGLPLHLTEGRQVIRSFGIGEGEEVGPRALTTMSARRVLTTGPAGYVFTAPDYEYVVEVWTEQGSRIAVFEGPTLNVSPVVSGAWSVDNPPANRIRDMHVDRAGRLWLSVRVRRPNWRNGVVERVRPDGRVGLDPVDGRLSSLYQARVDVVDLATCSLVASTRHDGILLTFVEPDLILELYQTVDGVPYLDVWQLSTP